MSDGTGADATAGRMSIEGVENLILLLPYNPGVIFPNFIAESGPDPLVLGTN